jgi:predicted nucleic-acid-binding protein
MIAVDTNVIVRLLTQDDELQYQKSLEILPNNNIFLPHTVVLETEWVLRFAYKLQPPDICSALRKLFGLPNVNLVNPNLVAQALQWHELGLDFADALHLAQSQSYAKFYTFDDKFVKPAKGLTNCEVKKP